MTRTFVSLTGAALALTLPSVSLADGPLDDGLAFSVSAVAKPNANGTAFSNRIGATTESFGGWLSLGFDRTGRHMMGTNSTQQTLNLGLGGRYLFATPGKAKAAPYAYGQALTNRASADSGSDVRDELASDIKRYSLQAGFGGEVAITKGLTVAAELGLQHDVVDYDEKDVRLMSIHTHLDTGILVNVYF